MKSKVKAQLTAVIQQAAQWVDEKEIYEAIKEWADSVQLQEPEAQNVEPIEVEDVKE